MNNQYGKKDIGGCYYEKILTLTIKVPAHFDHDDERQLDDWLANSIYKAGYELIDSAEYKNGTNIYKEKV